MFSFLAHRIELMKGRGKILFSKLRLRFMSDGTAHSPSSYEVAHAPFTDTTYMKEKYKKKSMYNSH
jgi:hypothetical protein